MRQRFGEVEAADEDGSHRSRFFAMPRVSARGYALNSAAYPCQLLTISLPPNRFLRTLL
jgi:hypothetical protein